MREGDHLESYLINGRIILKLIFEKWSGGSGINRSASGQNR
jgi:hypothetical protein